MNYYTLTVEAIQQHKGGKLGFALRSPDAPDDRDGQQVDVFVIECPRARGQEQSTEQAQESEQEG